VYWNCNLYDKDEESFLTKVPKSGGATIVIKRAIIKMVNEEALNGFPTLFLYLLTPVVLDKIRQA
jgi:hypothetical protein